MGGGYAVMKTSRSENQKPATRCLGHGEPGQDWGSTARDFVPWRFSDVCRESAWIVLCRPPRNLHRSGHSDSQRCVYQGLIPR